MSETTATLDAGVIAFAAAVRQQLTDLSAEEIDDLTGGLEADLTEQANDHGGSFQLGDPVEYAAELRAAAGLPDAVTGSQTSGRRIRDLFTDLPAALSRKARSTPFGSWLADFVLAIRPVWWVLRGWATFQLAVLCIGGRVQLFPVSISLWVLMIAAIVLSVQWGRGRWAPAAWLRVTKRLVSVAAIIALPFLGGWVGNELNNSMAPDAAPYVDTTGLWLDGQRVANIFGYDVEGNPIEVMQLFDQDGNPLVTVGADLVGEPADWNSQSDVHTVRSPHGTQGGGWNIYPLNEALLTPSGEVKTSNTRPASPPFATVYPLPGLIEQEATPAPTPPASGSSPEAEGVPTP